MSYTRITDPITVSGHSTTLRDEHRKGNVKPYAITNGAHQIEWHAIVNREHGAQAQFQVSEEDYRQLGGPTRT